VRLLCELGYEPNHRFNALNGATRMVMYDIEHERQLDVFVGESARARRSCSRIASALSGRRSRSPSCY